ncbi:murein biosynthesis integral membrane protein MurJ [Patescibacteria group bacterium]|nr:murein biosynthesis integral membrane protein MurJ [Patescibacteria group bacterium]
MMVSLPKIFKANGDWLERKQTSILSAAMVITIANIVSSAAGLLRERLLISSFFDTILSQQAYEAFLVAFQIPDTMFQLIVLGAVSAAFIPIFTDNKKASQEQAFAMTNTVMTYLLSLLVVISLVIIIFAEPLTRLRTGVQFSDHQIMIAANLTRFMLIAQFFFAISNFFTGMLQSFQRFIFPALAPILYNLGIVIGVYLLSGHFGIYAAGMGVILGACLHMLIQWPLIHKLGFRFKPNFNLQIPGVKKLFKLMPPRVLTYGLTEIQNLALGFFATSIGNLSFFVVRLALRLMAIPIRLFGVPISQASLAFLSEESGGDQHKRFVQLLLKSIHQITFFALPTSVLLLVLRIPVVRLVFGTHNLPWKTTLSIGRVLAILAISITAQAMVQLLVRAFHALKNTTTPLILTTITMAVYLGLACLFVFTWSGGILGIGLATSMAALVELVLFLVALNYHLKTPILTKAFFVPQAKMLVAGFCMAVFLYLPFKIFDELIFNTTKTIELIGLTVTTSTIGILVYLYFAALLNIKELKLITKIFESAIKWRSALAKSPEVLADTTSQETTV